MKLLKKITYFLPIFPLLSLNTIISCENNENYVKLLCDSHKTINYLGTITYNFYISTQITDNLIKISTDSASDIELPNEAIVNENKIFDINISLINWDKSKEINFSLTFNFVDLGNKSISETIANFRISYYDNPISNYLGYVIDNDLNYHYFDSFIDSNICGVSGDIIFLDGLSIKRDEFDLPICLASDIKKIDKNFLCNCINFNKNLTLPKSIKVIEQNFMHNCDNMTSTIDINCNPNAFDDIDNNVLSTDNVNSNIFTNGVVISGTYASDFKNKILPFYSSTDGKYRFYSNNYIRNWDDISWLDLSKLAIDGINFLSAQFKKNVDDFIGLEKNIKLYNSTHKVRIIGVNHDILSNDNTKTATLTFELVNLLTNDAGTILTSQIDEQNNFDFTTSIFHDNLVSGLKQTFIIGADCLSTIQECNNFLPKKVKKFINCCDQESFIYKIKSYDTYLFPLTCTEMCVPINEQKEGKPYEYWINNCYGNDCWKKYKNNTTEPFAYWIGSAYIDDSNCQWAISANNTPYFEATKNILAISFAFCI